MLNLMNPFMISIRFQLSYIHILWITQSQDHFQEVFALLKTSSKLLILKETKRNQYNLAVSVNSNYTE